MIGTYYRLSLADEDVGADKAESNSIQGQRGLVEGYITVSYTHLDVYKRQRYECGRDPRKTEITKKTEKKINAVWTN